MNTKKLWNFVLKVLVPFFSPFKHRVDWAVSGINVTNLPNVNVNVTVPTNVGITIPPTLSQSTIDAILKTVESDIEAYQIKIDMTKIILLRVSVVFPDMAWDKDLTNESRYNDVYHDRKSYIERRVCR